MASTSWRKSSLPSEKTKFVKTELPGRHCKRGAMKASFHRRPVAEFDWKAALQARATFFLQKKRLNIRGTHRECMARCTCSRLVKKGEVRPAELSLLCWKAIDWKVHRQGRCCCVSRFFVQEETAFQKGRFFSGIKIGILKRRNVGLRSRSCWSWKFNFLSAPEGLAVDALFQGAVVTGCVNEISWSNFLGGNVGIICLQVPMGSTRIVIIPGWLYSIKIWKTNKSKYIVVFWA